MNIFEIIKEVRDNYRLEDNLHLSDQNKVDTWVTSENLDPFDSERIVIQNGDIEINELIDQITKEEVMTEINTSGTGAYAWYVPYHSISNDWGIYIKAEGVLAIAAQVFNVKEFNTLDKIQAAFDLLYQHEHFHFQTELAASVVEAVAHTPVYKIIFNKHKYLEEALANAHAYRTRKNKNKKGLSKMIWLFMKNQPKGYNEFSNYVSQNDFIKGLRNYASLFLNTDDDPKPISPAEVVFISDKSKFKKIPIPMHFVTNGVGESIKKQMRYVSCIPRENIILTENFNKDLKSLTKIDQENIEASIKLLSNVSDFPKTKFKSLTNCDTLYSIRGRKSKKLRALLRPYNISNNLWEIIGAGQRENFYKKHC